MAHLVMTYIMFKSKALLLWLYVVGSSNIFYAFPLTYCHNEKNVYVTPKIFVPPMKIIIKIKLPSNQMVTPLAGNINVD